MAGYIEDRWLKKRPAKLTGKRERTAIYGTGKRYRVKGIPGIQDRSFHTSEDAKQWLASAKTDSSRGEFADPRKGEILLADYIVEHWWAGRSDEPSTADPMRSRIWNHIIPLVGDYALREIDASALRTFRAALLTRVEESTAEVIWGHLSSILGSAVDDQRLLRNPMKVKNSVKPPRAIDSKAKAWTREVVDAVRAGLQDRYQIAVDLGIGLGLRQGEAFGLAEEDFDFVAGVVHVRRQLRWDIKGRPYFSLPKGRKTREVPLPAPVPVDSLHAALAEPRDPHHRPRRAPAEADHSRPDPHLVARQPHLLPHLERPQLEACARRRRADQARGREGAARRRPNPPGPALCRPTRGHVPRPPPHLRERAAGGRRVGRQPVQMARALDTEGHTRPLRSLHARCGSARAHRDGRLAAGPLPAESP
ncbi:site-specific integrase [Streptomyces flaveolus]